MKPTKWTCLSLAVILSAAVLPSGVARSMDREVVAETETVFDSTAVVNVMNVPARALVCGMSVWLASIVMLASGGTRYGDAAEAMEDSCSGPWLVTRDMIDRALPQKKAPRRVVWELDNLR